jgi:hypothetical protein
VQGLASPDDGDALALTFAYLVAKKDGAEERRFEEGLQRWRGGSCDSAYPPANVFFRTATSLLPTR